MRRDHYHDPEQLLSLFCDCNPRMIPLHEAENVLLFDRLDEIFGADCSLRVEDVKYQPSEGRSELHEQIAAFLSRGFALEPALETGDVTCFAGARSALEACGQAMFRDQPGGRSVLVPAPYWHGFDRIYQTRLGGTVLPVPLAPDNFELTLPAIQDAYARSRPRSRMLLLTQPHNPLGVNYEPRFLEEVSRWVLEETRMDLVSDEIYAHCQMEGIRRSGFRSVLTLPIARDFPDRVHVVWGFAKDFGLSGFRVGVLASRSRELHDAVRHAAISGFSPMTSSNHWFLRKLFTLPASAGGRRPADRLMEELAPRLQDSFQAVTAALDGEGIPRFRGTHAAQFVWLDLRRWLDRVPGPAADSRIAEMHLLGYLKVDVRERDLHCYLGAEAEVSLLPGGQMASVAPGFFRLCFTAVDKDTAVEAVGRISKALRKLE